MFGTTMMLTVGQALDRAQHEKARIRLCVGGEWISGRVDATDSQGVTMTDDDGELCVLRMEAITCVRFPLSGRVPSQPTDAARVR